MHLQSALQYWRNKRSSPCSPPRGRVQVRREEGARAALALQLLRERTRRLPRRQALAGGTLVAHLSIEMGRLAARTL